MVKVCDAIMGSGKTSAAISYINAHPEKRFLYITPYLPEATRIKEGCPRAYFVEPSDQYSEFEFTKSLHSMQLIKDGRNIASTHQAMTYYTDETIRLLKENGYTVIIDEEVNVLQKDDKISFDDIKVAEKAGLIREVRPGEYERTDAEYGHGKYSHMLRLMASRPLLYSKGEKYPDVYYWIFSPGIFTELDDIIVMTYLFDQSEMQQYFEMFHVEYQYIGIKRTADKYEFTEGGNYIPEYVTHLKDMIQIDTKGRINGIGESRKALSMNWYKNHANDEYIAELKRNLNTFFRSHNPDKPGDKRMCGTYKDYWGKIRGKGYWDKKVSFCQKASNEYRDRTALAYPVNIFPNTDIPKIYKSYGARFYENHFALSTMVQWIWRSAIRDGKSISIYVPSKRMRGLLEDWISGVVSDAELVAAGNPGVTSHAEEL